MKKPVVAINPVRWWRAYGDASSRVRVDRRNLRRFSFSYRGESGSLGIGAEARASFPAQFSPRLITWERCASQQPSCENQPKQNIPEADML